MNCTGKRCIMQYDKVDPATCQCVSYCPQATPPRTNADRIRSMTDAEMAEWIMEMQACPYELYQDCQHPNYDCETCIKDWLKQEAEK